MLENNQHIKLENSLKIISLVPSQTELLYYLGLEEEVVGITKFCVHPNHWFKSKTRVGGTKNIDFNKIKLLQPNLIIANKEENVKEQIEELQQYFNVIVTDVNNVEESYEMITTIGELTKTTTKANQLIQQIKESFFQLKLAYKNTVRPSVCYLIWKEPYMTIGGDTFINDILNWAGFKNVFEQKNRYPQISLEELEKLQPDYIFLSSEPYPFKEQHKQELLKNHPTIQSKIILVDGEMFSWYGSRLLQSSNYLKKLILELP
ncbi:MAG: ABC transporter substrate-binding protein [Chitinophagaceae bacterium]|nr:ABC transporter substrate-binding protein [Chitinophagaceae bacterium]